MTKEWTVSKKQTVLWIVFKISTFNARNQACTLKRIMNTQKSVPSNGIFFSINPLFYLHLSRSLEIHACILSKTTFLLIPPNKHAASFYCREQCACSYAAEVVNYGCWLDKYHVIDSYHPEKTSLLLTCASFLTWIWARRIGSPFATSPSTHIRKVLT